jgi:glycosyltransferase involved in cell wall biosynthesis
VPKRILILTTSIAGGGAERTAALLSQHLDADVTLAVYETRRESYPHGGNFLNLKFTRSRGPLAKARSYMSRLRRLRRLKEQLQVDATISLLDPPNVMNLLSRGRGKTIISIRNYRSLKDREVHNAITKIENVLLSLLYNRADAVVVVSKAMANDMISNYGVRKDKIEVVYNSCDTELVSSAAADVIEPPLDAILRAPVLITVGKLQHQKGQWHLIRAFGRVKEVVQDARLVILGRGDLGSYLQRLAEELGLSTYTEKDLAGGVAPEGPDVFFLGYQTNPFKFLKRATVFALPSLYEGFPNVLLEAMACGLPVVSSDCLSGPREVLAPGLELGAKSEYPLEAAFGILLPTPDGVQYASTDALVPEEKLWADAIIELLQNEEKQSVYQVRSLERVAAFDVKEIMGRWERLLAEGLE